MSDHDYPPNAGQKNESGEEPVALTPEEQARNGDGDSNPAAAPGPESGAGDAAGPAPGEEEVAALNDRVLRLAAELENTRRRGEREKSDARRFAIADFARDLIGVADNFDRALAAAGADGSDPSPEALPGLIAGLRMTEKELLTVLERHGVRRLDPKGEKFDPHLHQAVAQVPSATIPAGHVVDVAQSGFTIGERVLRAAMVTVSSGAAATGETGAHADREA